MLIACYPLSPRDVCCEHCCPPPPPGAGGNFTMRACMRIDGLARFASRTGQDRTGRLGVGGGEKEGRKKDPQTSQPDR